MAYTVSLLTTVADCNSVIALAQKDKKNYEHKKDNLLFAKENSQENSSERQAKLLILNSEITMLQSVIAGLPEGEMKEEAITDLMRKQTAQRVLSSANNTATPVSLLDSELEIARLDQNISETLNFIAEVEAHKATL
jgi:hypothetical protein